MELLSAASPPLDVENAKHFELNDELRSLQERMAALFTHQKERGGIIDPEAEESKLLLVTDTPEVSISYFELFLMIYCNR